MVKTVVNIRLEDYRNIEIVIEGNKVSVQNEDILETLADDDRKSIEIICELLKDGLKNK